MLPAKIVHFSFISGKTLLLLCSIILSVRKETKTMKDICISLEELKKDDSKVLPGMAKCRVVTGIGF